jgi:hypothetical protein
MCDTSGRAKQPYDRLGQTRAHTTCNMTTNRSPYQDFQSHCGIQGACRREELAVHYNAALPHTAGSTQHADIAVWQCIVRGRCACWGCRNCLSIAEQRLYAEPCCVNLCRACAVFELVADTQGGPLVAVGVWHKLGAAEDGSNLSWRQPAVSIRT